MQVAIRNTSTDLTTIFYGRMYDRLIEIKSKFRRKRVYGTNQGSNFLVVRFCNRDTVRASNQFKRER